MASGVSARGAFSYPKSARLLRRCEFVRVNEHGSRFVEGPLAASWLVQEASTAAERAAGRARVGMTVSSKVGGAVVRNRLKRRLREAIRHELPLLPPVDLVLVARSSAARASVPELRAWLRRALRRLGETRAPSP